MNDSDRKMLELNQAKTRDDKVVMCGLEQCHSPAITAKLIAGKERRKSGSFSRNYVPFFSQVDLAVELVVEDDQGNAGLDAAFLVSSMLTWRRLWDVMLLIMLLWTLVSVPISIAFLESDCETHVPFCPPPPHSIPQAGLLGHPSPDR